MGVQVEDACDGEEAVKMVAASGEGYYHLIFMDVQMPNMDGYRGYQGNPGIRQSKMF